MKSLRTLLLAAGLLSLSLQSHLTAQNHPTVLPKIAAEVGILGLWGQQTNLSPLGLKYNDLYDGKNVGVRAQLLYRLDSRSAMGFDFQGYTNRKSIDELSAYGRARQTYWGLAFAKGFSSVSHPFTFKYSYSLGYVHTTYQLKPWGEGAKENFSAPGIGASIQITLGYRTSANRAIGLQIGLSAYNSFKWKGSDKLIAPEAYSTKFFGASSNQSLYPSIGIVLFNPLGF